MTYSQIWKAGGFKIEVMQFSSQFISRTSIDCFPRWCIVNQIQSQREWPHRVSIFINHKVYHHYMLCNFMHLRPFQNRESDGKREIDPFDFFLFFRKICLIRCF